MKGQQTGDASTSSPETPVAKSVSNIPKPNQSSAAFDLPAELPEIKNADHLLGDQELKIPAEIVHGVLHKGTKGVLASASKAGKTWLLLDLAISVATGKDFLNWKTTPGKVLFINFEIPQAFMKERIHHLKLKKEVTGLGQLYIWTLRGHTTNFDSLVKQMIDRIKSDGYSLIVLDPIYKGMVGRDENTAAGVGDLLNQIEKVAIETGAAVVYAHHFSKGNQSQKGVMDRMSGSGVFARDADSIICLTPHDDEDCYAVEVILRNFKSQPSFVVQFDFPLMKLRKDLDPDDLRGKGGRPAANDTEEFLALLDEKALTTTEWRDAAKENGFSRPTFYRKYKEMENSKFVEQEKITKKWRRVQNG